MPAPGTGLGPTRGGSAAGAAAGRRFARTGGTRDFIALTKPGLVAMILATTAVGFYLGGRGSPDLLLLLETLAGTGFSAAGAAALNQYLERDLDARMRRTCRRPLPGGRVRPVDALLFGSVLAVAGVLYLTVCVRPLGGFLAAFTILCYLFGYTPLKRRSALCTAVGAVPGALPPIIGWVAARGNLSGEAWALFAILFLWQLPHSLAIARLYREDYARAGFRLLPVVYRDGCFTEHQIVNQCATLLVVALTPTLLGLTGGLYFVCALVLGVVFLGCGIALAIAPSVAAARRVLLTSLVYLPLLLALMTADKKPL